MQSRYFCTEVGDAAEGADVCVVAVSTGEQIVIAHAQIHVHRYRCVDTESVCFEGSKGIVHLLYEVKRLC